MRAKPRKPITTEEFIMSATTKHSNRYDYLNVHFTTWSNKVIITCREHGDFMQVARYHLMGYGCSKCSGLKKGTTDEFIHKAQKIHLDRFDYSLVDFKNINNKVEIICKRHGMFHQIPKNHLNGLGCSKCKGEQNSKRSRSTTAEFIQKAQKRHGDLFDYSKSVYITTYRKVVVICRQHGDFLTSPHLHIIGTGCPKCNRKSQHRLFELIQSTFPKEEVIWEFWDKWLGKQRLDIFLPRLNVAVEYQGIQHYKPVSKYSRNGDGGQAAFEQAVKLDQRKRLLCQKNDCALFELQYDHKKADLDRLLSSIRSIIESHALNQAA